MIFTLVPLAEPANVLGVAVPEVVIVTVQSLAVAVPPSPLLTEIATTSVAVPGDVGPGVFVGFGVILGVGVGLGVAAGRGVLVGPGAAVATAGACVAGTGVAAVLGSGGSVMSPPVWTGSPVDGDGAMAADVPCALGGAVVDDVSGPSGSRIPTAMMPTTIRPTRRMASRPALPSRRPTTGGVG